MPSPAQLRHAPRASLWPLLLALLLTAGGSPARATEALADDAPTVRVMLVYGVWLSGAWEQAIRRELGAALAEVPGHRFELSEQFLGYYSERDSAPIDRFSRHVEALVRERDIRFVVCVMPAACDFVTRLDLGGGTRVITIGAPPAVIERVSGRSDTTVITSASTDAIRGTFQHIAALRPRTETVHLLAGSGISDRDYLRRALALGDALDLPFALEAHVATAPDSLIRAAERLDADKDTIFVLATEAWGPEARPFPTGSLDRAVQGASAPAFVFWDAAIGDGIVGGKVASAVGYMRQARDLMVADLDGRSVPALVPGEATAVYDAAVARRWGIDPTVLDGPVRLRNVQPTLWEANPGLVIAVVLAGLMLLAVIALLGAWVHLHRRNARVLAEREQAARESEARYRLVADRSVDIIWTFDVAADRFVFCSPAVEAVTGWSAEQFMAMPPDRVLPEDTIAAVEELLASDMTDVVLELDILRADGDTVPCEIALQVLREATGEATRVVGVTRDITARRAREEADRAAEDDLRRRQKMEALGNLAAGIAHDFNNVLGVIRGLVDLLALDHARDPAARDLAQRLDAATERARRLVKRVLTFARSGREEPVDVDLEAALRRCTTHLETAIPEDVRLDIDLDDAPWVHADPNQIEQAVVNLVTNAIEAADHPRGRVRVALDVVDLVNPGKALIGELHPGRWARIRVEDNGPGIAAADAARIFEPFYTSKDLGSGIGLAIVHGVVLDHQGALQLDSTPGVGTSFTVYLPVLEPSTATAPRPATATSAAPSSASDSLRVLVVDDQQELLDVFAALLTALGHRTRTCNDPAAVPTLLDGPDGPFDVLITDYSMPGTTGTELLRHCHRHHPGIATFLVTGFAEQDTEAEALAHGARGVLGKPLTMQQLAAALADVRPAEAPHSATA